MDQTSFLTGVEILDTSVATSSSASLYTYGGISIFNTSTANSTSGSFLTFGGATIYKNTLIGGDLNITSTTQSTNTSTGAVTISGGLSVQNNLYGNSAIFSNIQSTIGATFPNLIVDNASIGSLSISLFNPTNITTNNLVVLTSSSISNAIFSNVTTTNLTLTNDFSAQTITVNNDLRFNNTSGAFIIIESPGYLRVGADSQFKTHFLVVGDTFGSEPGRINYRYQNYISFDNVNGSSTSIEKIRITANGDLGIGTINPSSKLHVIGHAIITGNTTIGTGLFTPNAIINTVTSNNAFFNSTLESTSTSTGAVIVTGGVGIGGALNVSGDIVVGGNLTVSGTLVTVNSTTVNISDNVLVLNAGPSGTSDSGVLVNRYQISNNTGTGDVVSDTIYYSGIVQFGTTTSVIVLPNNTSSIDSFYNGYWVKITSGFANNNVRQIVSYTGSTRTATLSSALTILPNVNIDMFNLYGNSYSTNYFKESTNEYVLGYTNDATNSVITDTTYANLRLSNLTGNLISSSNLITTNISGISQTIGNILATNINSTNVTINNLALLSSLNIPTLSVVTTASIGTSFLVGTSAVIGTTLQVMGATQLDGATSITGTLNVLGGVTIGALTAGATTVTSLTTNQLTITNLICTNETITNTLVTNLRATTSTITNLNLTGLTSANLTVSSLTKLNLATVNIITSGNILVTGSPTSSNIITIDAQNSTVNPAVLLFKNTGGTGDFRIYGDGGDVQIQGGGGRTLQLASYHEIRLGGGRNITSNIPFIPGNGSTYNTIVYNSNNSIALTVQANSIQTVDLQQWIGSSGNIYSKIDKTGNLVINSTNDSISSITGGSITTSGGISVGKSVKIGSTVNSSSTSTGSLVVSGGAGFNGDIYAKNIYSNGILVGGGSGINLFGTEYNYTELLASSGTTSTSFIERISMTTSPLLGGDYKINIGYTFENPSSTNTDGIFRGLLDPSGISTGTLIHEYQDRNTRSTYVRPQYTSVLKNLTPGIHVVSLIYASASNNSAIYISNARIELFRVQ